MLPAMEKHQLAMNSESRECSKRKNAHALYTVVILHIQGHTCRPEGLKHKGVQLKYRHTN